MRRIYQHAMAATFCAAALFAGPALSNSLHDEGDFGGGYAIIGPSGGPERYDYVRKHTFARITPILRCTHITLRSTRMSRIMKMM